MSNKSENLRHGDLYLDRIDNYKEVFVWSGTESNTGPLRGGPLMTAKLVARAGEIPRVMEEKLNEIDQLKEELAATKRELGSVRKSRDHYKAEYDKTQLVADPVMKATTLNYINDFKAVFESYKTPEQKRLDALEKEMAVLKGVTLTQDEVEEIARDEIDAAHVEIDGDYVRLVSDDGDGDLKDERLKIDELATAVAAALAEK